jgi:hypothetical protein
VENVSGGDWYKAAGRTTPYRSLAKRRPVQYADTTLERKTVFPVRESITGGLQACNRLAIRISRVELVKNGGKRLYCYVV